VFVLITTLNCNTFGGEMNSPIPFLVDFFLGSCSPYLQTNIIL